MPPAWARSPEAAQIQRIERLQAIACDRKDREIRLLDAALLHQLLSDRDGHAAGCFGEYAFGLGQQLDARNDFLIRAIFAHPPDSGISRAAK